MSTIEVRRKDFYLNKPECVIDLPEWVLPPDKVEAYRAMPRLAIVEIAGRDSVAAAVKSVEDDSFTDLLPTYVYTGTEYGPWASVEVAVERLARRLPEVQVHELLILGSPSFWQALNGRFISELISRYGFYTPCVGCHLYLHSVRTPLSLTLGSVPIISGERVWHDKSIKINQTNEALNVYQDLATAFGTEFLFPLRNIVEGNRITEILGYDWQEGTEQLDCVLSKNYHPYNERMVNIPRQLQRYLEEFVRPCAEKIVESYVAGYVPNHFDLARQVLMRNTEH